MTAPRIRGPLKLCHSQSRGRNNSTPSNGSGVLVGCLLLVAICLQPPPNQILLHERTATVLFDLRPCNCKLVQPVQHWRSVSPFALSCVLQVGCSCSYSAAQGAPDFAYRPRKASVYANGAYWPHLGACPSSQRLLFTKQPMGCQSGRNMCPCF